MMANMISQRCIIVGNTVTGLCTATMDQLKGCDDATMVKIEAVPYNYTSISGTLSV
ncbi:hypothetical protein KIN20_003755 [Parelaphostrongylus tenuis]|uniref:Uncharacterized protein n=1 Tax=Parelaphostrongylus tenuis TaxID=148309 RepID=A0AAD5MIW3_PARTN|nr:hypothetical protein KIN20_003755 [Parelaphostrongylus tenuis]